eukprot:TRINITY_DN11010_c0_g1_i1.p1 TRINITY_DN11010_c0_g1~~TRINITY_DN11010_c0_g1_i1.p1  ORF type:complete len:397 (+),score=72.78 TRINITY_DN11010_c0_g1_i1:67-1257(+)
MEIESTTPTTTTTCSDSTSTPSVAGEKEGDFDSRFLVLTGSKKAVKLEKSMKEKLVECPPVAEEVQLEMEIVRELSMQRSVNSNISDEMVAIFHRVDQPLSEKENKMIEERLQKSLEKGAKDEDYWSLVISKQQEKFGKVKETSAAATLSTCGLSEDELEKKTDELFHILDSKRKEKEAKRKEQKKKKYPVLGLFCQSLLKDSYDFGAQLMFTESTKSLCSLFKGPVAIENVLNNHLARKFVRQWVIFRGQYGENSKEATPVLGFHGTKFKNIPTILNTGLMVPGGKEEVVNGSVGGVGIYLGKRPMTSKNYAEKGRMLACAALPGREGKGPEADSHTILDVMIFYNSDQVLPLYLVHYWGISSKYPDGPTLQKSPSTLAPSPFTAKIAAARKVTD